MKNIEELRLGLEGQLNEYGHTQDTLSSVHHVLGEALLSLADEYREGMNKYQVEKIYKKLNTVEQLLFYMLIGMKEDNEETADLLDAFENELSYKNLDDES